STHRSARRRRRFRHVRTIPAPALGKRSAGSTWGLGSRLLTGIRDQVDVEQLEAEVLNLRNDAAELGVSTSHPRHAIVGLDLTVRECRAQRWARRTLERQ